MGLRTIRQIFQVPLHWQIGQNGWENDGLPLRPPQDGYCLTFQNQGLDIAQTPLLTDDSVDRPTFNFTVSLWVNALAVNHGARFYQTLGHHGSAHETNSEHFYIFR